MNKLYKKKEQEKEKAKKTTTKSVSFAIIISTVKAYCGEGRVYM